jgi:Secretion system C-terminal sorting domain
LSHALSIISLQSNAQHVNYSYDANGNRTGRQYSPTRLRSDTPKDDAKANEVASQYGIGVYPNPLMDGSNVTVAISTASDKPGEQATVYVLDNTGKVLFTQKQTTSSPSQLDLSPYSGGIYYVKVAIGKEELFYKITKAK